MSKKMIFKKTYRGFEDFYDFYRDSSEVLESWNTQFNELADEFENDILFYFEAVPLGEVDTFQELQSKLESKAKELEAERVKSRDYEKALTELGHFGIDFGHGEYTCDVAKISQQVLEKHNQEKESGE